MLIIGGRGGKHAFTLGRSRAMSLETKRLSISPFEVQSPCALARIPSNELNNSPSSANKSVVSSERSPLEGRRVSPKSNNESDVPTMIGIVSKMERVKPPI